MLNSPTNRGSPSIYILIHAFENDKLSRVQFQAGGLGVAFFATGPGWVYLSDIFVTLEFTLL